LATSFCHAGPQWDLGEDAWLKACILGQVHGSYTNCDTDLYDVYLRRGRIILAGQVMDGVTFFVETDNDGAGKRGRSVSMDIQDAFVDIRIMNSEHWVEVGLILLPFSFETRSSAASLLGLDYNCDAVKFVNTFVWRDYGAELHGSLFDKRISYCIGAFDGYDVAGSAKNPDADVRFTGHVALNLVGQAETGWFYCQNRQDADAYVSLGAGYDWQDKATLVSVPVPSGSVPVVAEADSVAWVVDMQSGFGLGCSDVTINAAWYDWDNSAFKGNTAFIEAGIQSGKTMLTGKYSIQDPDGPALTEDYTAGVHYFLKKHNARGGIEYRWGDSPEMVLVGVQFLL
jgi:hypothetical protein